MENPQSWTKEFFLNNQDECVKKLDQLSVDERVALRNNLTEMANGKLILLSGMVSDILEPEFYCEKYQVKNFQDGSVRIELGKFSDEIEIADHEVVEGPSKHLSERHTILITKPQSNNSWIYELETQLITSPTNKRKLRTERDMGSVSFIVKAYDSFDLPMNSLVNVVGFLSITRPRLETEDGDENVEGPPFVIHSVSIDKLLHNNPLLLDHLSEQLSPEDIQKDLLKLFTQIMFGDELAAHYLLCCLISSVYARVGVEVLGKFSLNLLFHAIPEHLLADYVKKLYHIIELIMPNSLYLPLTIENLNTVSFVPKKDYTSNRLQPGILQQPVHTHLVLDETKLETGKLDQAGCMAVADLSELIKSQTVQYDFQYYKIPFNTSFPVLILSHGKSILPSDFVVPIKINDIDAVKLIPENIAAGLHFLKPKLNAIRRYLTECRMQDFEITESGRKLIESDFVKLRETTNVQVEDLHSLLVISRLVGISRGLKKFELESWATAKRLENWRLERIDNKTVEA